MSRELEGGFLTIGPPGRSLIDIVIIIIILIPPTATLISGFCDLLPASSLTFSTLVFGSQTTARVIFIPPTSALPPRSLPWFPQAPWCGPQVLVWSDPCPPLSIPLPVLTLFSCRGTNPPAHRAGSCLRAFALADPATWNTLRLSQPWPTQPLGLRVSVQKAVPGLPVAGDPFLYYPFITLFCNTLHSQRCQMICVLYDDSFSSLRLPRWCSGKESACQCRRCKRLRLNPWVGKIPWSRKRQPTPVFLAGKFHRQRSLAGYSPWSCRV